MKVDINKFSAWLEKTVRAGIADQRILRELKLSQKNSKLPENVKGAESLNSR